MPLVCTRQYVLYMKVRNGAKMSMNSGSIPQSSVSYSPVNRRFTMSVCILIE